MAAHDTGSGWPLHEGALCAGPRRTQNAATSRPSRPAAQLTLRIIEAAPAARVGGLRRFLLSDSAPPAPGRQGAPVSGLSHRRSQAVASHRQAARRKWAADDAKVRATAAT